MRRSACGKQMEAVQSASNSICCAVTMPSIVRYVLRAPVYWIQPSMDNNNPHSKQTADMSVPYTTDSSHVSAWAVCAPSIKLIFPQIVFHSFSSCTPLPSAGFPIVTNFPLTIPHRLFKVFFHFSFGYHSIYRTFPTDVDLLLPLLG
jgi:hypothetical protein